VVVMGVLIAGAEMKIDLPAMVAQPLRNTSPPLNELMKTSSSGGGTSAPLHL
jgi:hypothetical protein